jgi:hypothetical protein
MARAGVQMCYYPAAPPFYVIVGLSGTRVVRVPCMVMATLCCADACVCVGVAAECARLRRMALGSASIKRFMFLIMPKMCDCAKSVSASDNDLNKR